MVSSAWGQVTINEYVDDERTARPDRLTPTRASSSSFITPEPARSISAAGRSTTKQIGDNFNLPAGTKTYTIPASQSIPAGGYYVVGAAGVPNVNFTPPNAYRLELICFPDGVEFDQRQPRAGAAQQRSNALIDAIADETFRGTERANLNAEQVAQSARRLVGPGPVVQYYRRQISDSH